MQRRHHGGRMRERHENATLAPTLMLVEAVAIIICQSNGSKVVMRANAYCYRKLKGARPFGGIIPPVSTPFFSWFYLIDSPLNVALHLDVIRTVLSEKMKDLSIPGFIPFILHK